MQQNQQAGNDRNKNSEQNNESLNTASGLRNELQQEQDDAGSGRSYDYGTEGSNESSTEEGMNQQLGRNSNQQNVSNPTTTPGAGSDPIPGTGRSDTRAGTGSGLTTKQNITGSDFVASCTCFKVIK